MYSPLSVLLRLSRIINLNHYSPSTFFKKESISSLQRIFFIEGKTFIIHLKQIRTLGGRYWRASRLIDTTKPLEFLFHTFIINNTTYPNEYSVLSQIIAILFFLPDAVSLSFCFSIFVFRTLLFQSSSSTQVLD